jgi:hypothetical protein
MSGPDVLTSWKSLSALLSAAKHLVNHTSIMPHDINTEDWAHLPQAIKNADHWMKESKHAEELAISIGTNDA